MNKNWYNLGKLSEKGTDQEKISVIDCSSEGLTRHFTRAQIEQLIDACARGIVGIGFKRGERIGIIGFNRVEFLIAYLAIMRAGFVAVPINPNFNQNIKNHVFSDCELAGCFVAEGLTVQLPREVVSLSLGGPLWEELLDWGDFDSVKPSTNELAMILYTSGSTGYPKGVMLSHEGQIWTLKSRFRFRESYDNERFIVAAPMYHMNALTSCKFALCADASLVLMPRFDARTFVRAISDHDVTWITSVPTMMALVLRQLDELKRYDVSKVRYIRMGSAPASKELYDAVQKAFPSATVAGGYGATETGPIIFGPVPSQKLPPHGGLGWVLPDVNVKLVDEFGQLTDRGELYVKTPANMLGYLNMETKTKEVLDADGWYKTGDIFYRDESGCYYFVGRVDDMFVCGGENIYPTEIEEIIQKIDGVVSTSVVPIPDEIKGQKPVAFIVKRSESVLTEEDIKEFVLKNAPAYMHPRKVFFLDELPLTSVNKIDRKRLREIVSARDLLH